MRGSEQMAAWASAANAALRLLLWLSQLHAWCRQQELGGGEDDPEALQAQPACRVAVSFTVQLWMNGAVRALDWTESASFRSAANVGQLEVQAGLVESLCELHSRSCRLIHWLLEAPDHPALIEGFWQGAIFGHSNTLQLAALLVALKAVGDSADSSACFQSRQAAEVVECCNDASARAAAAHLPAPVYCCLPMPAARCVRCMQHTLRRCVRCWPLQMRCRC